MESLYCAGTLIVIVIVIVSFCFFYSLYQTAAYAMGKHVPSGNLFPTVRTRRPTEQREYLLSERVCLPTDRPTDRTTLDASTVLLLLITPCLYAYGDLFQLILSYIHCEEQHQ